jgi:hypothetical protein
MRQLTSLIASSVAAVLLLVTTAAAAPPTRLDFEDDETFPSFFTDLCGVPVFLHIEGSGTNTLFYDQDGNVIRELDTIPGGLEFTLFSPEEAGGTGKSLSFSLYGTVTFRYPEGIDVGDPATVTIVGAEGQAAGGPARAGRQVFHGVIIGYTADGVPIVEPVTLISESGVSRDPAVVIAERCAILTGLS